MASQANMAAKIIFETTLRRLSDIVADPNRTDTVTGSSSSSHSKDKPVYLSDIKSGTSLFPSLYDGSSGRGNSTSTVPTVQDSLPYKGTGKRWMPNRNVIETPSFFCARQYVLHTTANIVTVSFSTIGRMEYPAGGEESKQNETYFYETRDSLASAYDEFNLQKMLTIYARMICLLPSTAVESFIQLLYHIGTIYFLMGETLYARPCFREVRRKSTDPRLRQSADDAIMLCAGLEASKQEMVHAYTEVHNRLTLGRATASITAHVIVPPGKESIPPAKAAAALPTPSSTAGTRDKSTSTARKSLRRLIQKKGSRLRPSSLLTNKPLTGTVSSTSPTTTTTTTTTTSMSSSSTLSDCRSTPLPWSASAFISPVSNISTSSPSTEKKISEIQGSGTAKIVPPVSPTPVSCDTHSSKGGVQRPTPMSTSPSITPSLPTPPPLPKTVTSVSSPMLSSSRVNVKKKMGGPIHGQARIRGRVSSTTGSALQLSPGDGRPKAHRGRFAITRGQEKKRTSTTTCPPPTPPEKKKEEINTPPLQKTTTNAMVSTTKVTSSPNNGLPLTRVVTSATPTEPTLLVKKVPCTSSTNESEPRSVTGSATSSTTSVAPTLTKSIVVKTAATSAICESLVSTVVPSTNSTTTNPVVLSSSIGATIDTSPDPPTSTSSFSSVDSNRHVTPIYAPPSPTPPLPPSPMYYCPHPLLPPPQYPYPYYLPLPARSYYHTPGHGPSLYDSKGPGDESRAIHRSWTSSSSFYSPAAVSATRFDGIKIPQEKRSVLVGDLSQPFAAAVARNDLKQYLSAVGAEDSYFVLEKHWTLRDIALTTSEILRLCLAPLQVIRILGNVRRNGFVPSHGFRDEWSPLFTRVSSLEEYIHLTGAWEHEPHCYTTLSNHGVKLSDLPLMKPTDLSDLGIKFPITLTRMWGNLWKSLSLRD